MKKAVLVVGLGTFGSQTAKALFEGGATVLAIDRDEKAVEAISGLVTRAICVDVSNEEALRTAGALDVDLAVVALRHHFATSVLAVHMLRKADVKEILVHVETQQEGDAIRTVGATHVIFPERDMAWRIAQRILVPDLTDHIPLGDNISIVEVACPKAFAGKSLQELDIRKRHRITVIAIKSPPEQAGETANVLVAPEPETPLQKGDVLVVIGETNLLGEFKKAVAGMDKGLEAAP